MTILYKLCDHIAELDMILSLAQVCDLNFEILTYDLLMVENLNYILIL